MKSRLENGRLSAARLTEAKALSEFQRDLSAVSRLRMNLARQTRWACADLPPDPIGMTDLRLIGDAAVALRRLRDHPTTTQDAASMADLALVTVLRTVEAITATIPEASDR